MDNILVGSVVKNLGGRDSGKLFVVIATDENFAFIANGRSRFLSSPKRKNKKHIAQTGFVCDLNGISTDRGLRRYLKEVEASQTIYKGGCDLG